MNKYQNTSRVLVLGFQVLIFLLFGAFGCYYGFFAVPAYLTSNPTINGIVSSGYAYNLFLELGVIGLTEMTIAIYGIAQGLKGIREPNNDTPVRNGFTAFIVQGYLAAVFFFLNAFVFFDLVKGTNLIFVIVMALILTIVLMIATNIPMVRLYDNEDQKPLLAGMTFGFGIAGAWVAILSALTLVCSFTVDSQAFYSQMRILLIIGVVGGLAIALLLGFAGRLLLKGKKENASEVAGYLSSGALGVSGIVFLAMGILDIVWKDNLCHFNSASKSFDYGYPFPIMAIILGALLLVGATAFLVLSYKGTNAKATNHKA